MTYILELGLCFTHRVGHPSRSNRLLVHYLMIGSIRSIILARTGRYIRRYPISGLNSKPCVKSGVWCMAGHRPSAAAASLYRPPPVVCFNSSRLAALDTGPLFVYKEGLATRPTLIVQQTDWNDRFGGVGPYIRMVRRVGPSLVCALACGSSATTAAPPPQHQLLLLVTVCVGTMMRQPGPAAGLDRNAVSIDRTLTPIIHRCRHASISIAARHIG